MKIVACILFYSLLSARLAAQSGAMSIVYLDPDTLFGAPGSTFVHNATVTNSSAQSLDAHILRTQNLPGTWESAIAIYASFPPTTGSANISLSTGDNPFELHFFTDSVPAISGVTITLTNLNDTTELIQKTFYVSTLQQLNAVTTLPPSRFHVFPNPVQNVLHVSYFPVDIYDAVGKLTMHGESLDIDVSNLQPGVYFLRYDGNCRTIVKQ